MLIYSSKYTAKNKEGSSQNVNDSEKTDMVDVKGNLPKSSAAQAAAIVYRSFERNQDLALLMSKTQSPKDEPEIPFVNYQKRKNEKLQQVKLLQEN